MKFSIVALATVASAAVIDKRFVVFQARNFSASCVPHSSLCKYSFNLFQPGTFDTTGYDCAATAPGAGVEVLPEIKDGTCPPSSRTFDVVRSDEGLTLIAQVQVTPISFTKGSHFIPNDQIKNFPGTTPTGEYQAYVGPTDFDLEYID